MKPLEDVRIIALEQYGAGPFGTLHLADLGADVIKIEDPASGGDIGRYVPPFQNGEDSLFFETFNRNKRSLSLDIKIPAGRAVFEDLVRISNIVYSNLRGDVPEKLRIRYSDLKHLNPAIVCCSLSGFGMTGPRRSEPGYDYVLQAIAGWMDITGEPDGPPTKSGLSLVDYSGGFVAVVSMLAALHAARRDGIGADCDVSLFDTAISMLTYPAVWSLNSDYTPSRTHYSAHPSVVPFQVFPTSDGWLVVACPKDKFWHRLIKVMGLTDIAEDVSFSSLAGRREHSAELLQRLERVFLTRSSEEWLTGLRAAGVPCGPVNSVAEALADPQTSARNMIARTTHPHFGPVQQLASPVRVGNAPPAYRRAPCRNEDASPILAELLRYPASKISSLRDRGAFGIPSGERQRET
jgi:crotonobetainyl-CoA:carnitine CoA-transferase CaiB-like acyl-CoA transferase